MPWCIKNTAICQKYFSYNFHRCLVKSSIKSIFLDHNHYLLDQGIGVITQCLEWSIRTSAAKSMEIATCLSPLWINTIPGLFHLVPIHHTILVWLYTLNFLKVLGINHMYSNMYQEEKKSYNRGKKLSATKKTKFDFTLKIRLFKPFVYEETVS